MNALTQKNNMSGLDGEGETMAGDSGKEETRGETRRVCQNDCFFAVAEQ